MAAVGMGGWMTPVARYGDMSRFSNVELAARSKGGDCCGMGKVIPAAQLRNGNTETVGDGNEGVSAACTVEGGA